MKKQDMDRKSHSFAFRIEAEIWAKLGEQAYKYAVPRTQIMRWALLEFLDEHNDDDQPKRTPAPYIPADHEHGIRIPRGYVRKL